MKGIVKNFEDGFWVIETDGPNHLRVLFLREWQCHVSMKPGLKVQLEYKSNSTMGMWYVTKEEQ